MASPAAASEAENKPSGADYEQVPFQFCREWSAAPVHSPSSLTAISSNMLLPKEDRETSTLMYVCRTCAHAEPAKTPCVYRNQLHNTVGETAGVTQDVGADPTVGTTVAASAAAATAAATSHNIDEVPGYCVALNAEGAFVYDICEDFTCSLCGREEGRERRKDSGISLTLAGLWGWDYSDYDEEPMEEDESPSKCDHTGSNGGR